MEITREHKAGLELAINSGAVTCPSMRESVKKMIAEPIPGTHVLTYPDGSCRPASDEEVLLWALLNRTKADNASKNGTIKALGKQISQLTSKNKALSKRVDPSEVERERWLREKAEDLCRAVQDQRDAATQRADAAERKLGEAVGLLRESKPVVLGTQCAEDYDLAERIESLLSASAEPANEVES